MENKSFDLLIKVHHSVFDCIDFLLTRYKKYMLSLGIVKNVGLRLLTNRRV